MNSGYGSFRISGTHETSDQVREDVARVCELVAKYCDFDIEIELVGIDVPDGEVA